MTRISSWLLKYDESNPHLVHGAIVAHVGQEDGHIDNIGERGSLRLEDDIDAIQNSIVALASMIFRC